MYHPPKFKEMSYNCPHCGTYARQYWGNVSHHAANFRDYIIDKLQVARCEKCGFQSYWIDGKMVYPDIAPVPLANTDMPKDVLEVYDEAKLIVNKSPRGAAALLRLGLQLLMPHLGESGKKINEDIKSLVGKGLNADVQKALDLVRVIGNNAVHPGQIDISDDIDAAMRLFGLLNFIVDNRISQPKRLEKLYTEKMPESTKKAIEKRNKK